MFIAEILIKTPRGTVRPEVRQHLVIMPHPTPTSDTTTNVDSFHLIKDYLGYWPRAGYKLFLHGPNICSYLTQVKKCWVDKLTKYMGLLHS